MCDRQVCTREGVLNREGVFAAAAPSCSESPCLYNPCGAGEGDVCERRLLIDSLASFLSGSNI